MDGAPDWPLISNAAPVTATREMDNYHRLERDNYRLC
jgi:hypothetical protein